MIVRLPNWIGDFCMATPVLTDLRSRFPAAEITAMCHWPISDLLKLDAAVDKVFCFNRADKNMRKTIEKLRAEKYDLGILLTNSFSSAWWLWQARIERRMGFAGNWRSLLLTDPMEMPSLRIHQVDFYKHLLQPLEMSISETAPRLFFSDQEAEEAMKLLYDRGYPKDYPLIGINPGAAFGPAKCWPPERFRALALRLLQDPDVFVVVFGDSSGGSLAKEICMDAPERIINLAGATTLRQLACLIKHCDVLVTNDSGPMHIGAALQTPIVALFGSTDDAVTGPWGQKGAVINRRVGCSPCFKRTCPTDFRCMTQIEVDEVAHKTLERVKERV